MDYRGAFTQRGDYRSYNPNRGSLPSERLAQEQSSYSPDERRQMEDMKSTMVKKLEITKNPNLYSYGEVLRYNEYDLFVKNQLEQRKDRHLHLRTDDIEGATHRKFTFDKRARGKKVKDFFPEVPNVNTFYNNINGGLETNNNLTSFEQTTPIRAFLPKATLKSDFLQKEQILNARKSTGDEIGAGSYQMAQYSRGEQTMGSLQSQRSNRNGGISARPLHNVYEQIKSGGMHQTLDRPSMDNQRRQIQLQDQAQQPLQMSKRMSQGDLRANPTLLASQNGGDSQLKHSISKPALSYYPSILQKQETPIKSLLEKNFTTSSKDYGNFMKGQDLQQLIEELKQRQALQQAQ